MKKDIQDRKVVSRWVPLMSTLLFHGGLFLLLAVNMHSLRDLFPRHGINEVIEFIEFQDLSGSYGNPQPQVIQPPPVVAMPEPAVEKVEESELLEASREMPEDFTADVVTSDEGKNDSISVVEVSGDGGQIGFGTGTSGIGDYKLPTFLGRDGDYFHIWFQEQFKYPADLKDRYDKKVTVVFMIDKEGNVTRVSVRNCYNELIAGEINRVMKASPRWSPAQRRGINTDHYIQMQININ